MPLQRLEFKPGIDLELTATANRGGYSDGSLIRFREGRPEPHGGWTHLTADQPSGVVRGLHYWVDLSQGRRIAVGSSQRLYVLPTSTGNLIDISPSASIAGSISSGATPYSLLVWSLDNFGQILLGVPSGKGLYAWDPSVGGHASLVTQAPAVNQGMLVLMPQQIVMAYGCTPVAGGAADPLLVRWTTQSDYSVWVATTTNQAGSFRLSRGNRIIGAIQAPNFGLIWTDSDLWIAQYIGFPLVFKIDQIGSNCGLIAQKAAGVLSNTVYWMSTHGFHRLVANAPEELPCPVWDLVFQDLDTANQDKCFVGVNTKNNEVYFFFPSLSGGTGEIDSYVKVNVADGIWDIGRYIAVGSPSPMARTAWTDQNQAGAPYAIDLNGLVQAQEIGLTMDGAGAVPARIRTAFQDIADGGRIMVFDQFVPDFKWGSSDARVDLTIYYRNWPDSPVSTMGPFRIGPTTKFITLKKPRQLTVGPTPFTVWAAPRAREIALEFSNAVGWWRLGTPRINAYPAGSL